MLLSQCAMSDTVLSACLYYSRVLPVAAPANPIRAGGTNRIIEYITETSVALRAMEGDLQARTRW